MGAWYCLLVIMLVIGLRWRQDGAQSSVLSVESASVLNGASILFVFVQHIHAFLYTRFVSFKDFGSKNNLLSVCFIMVVLTFTMKVKIVSPVLSWCGKHVFPLYMYHGLFFLIVRSLDSGSLTPLVAHALIAAVLVMTLLTAKYYHYWEVR